MDRPSLVMVLKRFVMRSPTRLDQATGAASAFPDLGSGSGDVAACTAA